ncbi:hypothetical protein QJS04_geneDACA000534 [Acorus gramineus]|uniref:Uncharacterized protein n=1 Tax=Acorus gramineus TaxID=55184 RepID=A0AAV9ASI0_ACOGR|nr:hypothetical protein QJS04_geneDACA000534 [Acorus gramineus]
MGEATSFALRPSLHHLHLSSRDSFHGGGRRVTVGPGSPRSRRECRASVAMTEKPVTFSATIASDLPLYEPPGTSFDGYLNDRPRIFRAMFPDQRRSQQLNDEEWKIQMLPIDFLLVSVKPVVVMRLRCKSQGKNYPSGVPRDIGRVLELQANVLSNTTRWELQGLEGAYKPSHFALSVQGALYADRRGFLSRLKGKLEMSITFILPPVLALVPQDVLKSIVESLLKRLVGRMKQEVDGSLLADYMEYRKERLKQRENMNTP